MTDNPTPETDQGGALIDEYLRFLRDHGPEPDLSQLSPEQRQVVVGQFEIVKALADRDAELPPLDRDPVARRLGLHQPAAEAQQPTPRCTHCTHPKSDHDGRADHRAKDSPLVADEPDATGSTR